MTTTTTRTTTTRSTTARGPSRRRQRTLQRAVHLIAGLVLLAQIYAASWLGPAFTAAVRWVLIPVVLGTGIAMWQGPRIRRRIRGTGPRRA